MFSVLLFHKDLLYSLTFFVAAILCIDKCENIIPAKYEKHSREKDKRSFNLGSNVYNS